MLERMFHSAPGVFALGEFQCLWRLAAKDIACACGSPFSADQRWQAITARAGVGPEEITELRNLEARVSRSAFLAGRGFSLDRLRADPDVKRFRELQHALFDAIACETGAHTLIDSSKAAPRAWLLGCDPDVRIAHLTRAASDVLLSWRSRKYDPGLGTAMARPAIGTAALDWLKAERLIGLLGQRRPVTRIDYAELCSAPRERFDKLRNALDLRVPLAAGWTGPDCFLPADDYHSLNGNPDRFDRGPVEVRLRRPDWGAVPAPERAAIRLTAAALGVLAPSWQRAL